MLIKLTYIALSIVGLIAITGCHYDNHYRGGHGDRFNRDDSDCRYDSGYGRGGDYHDYRQHDGYR